MGDRIIARRNDRQLNVDNGTLATITGFDHDRRAILITTDSGETRALTPSYLARHVEHAYAITGHSSQGATLDAAIVVGRPEEFAREWAHTALSRGRHDTTIHLIADHGPTETDRREYAAAQPAREPADALARAMHRTEAEPLAVEQQKRDERRVTDEARRPLVPSPPPAKVKAPAGPTSNRTLPGETRDRHRTRRSSPNARAPFRFRPAPSKRACCFPVNAIVGADPS